MESKIKCCSRNVRKLESEKNDINPTALTQETVPKLMDLYPVDPFTSGYGPPYAPDNWPCPGDKWKWSVGKKIKPSGIFQDRYLYLPPHFQRPYDGRAYIAVKSHVEKYIRSVFPDKDFAAFLASFSWDIPAKNFRCSKANTAPRLSSKPQKMKEHKNDDDEEEFPAAYDEEERVEKPTYTRKRKGKREQPPTSMCRRKTRHSYKCRFPSNIKKLPILIDLTKEPESEPSYSWTRDNTEKTSKSENDQVSSHRNYVSSIGTSHSNANLQESMDSHQEPFETSYEDPNLSIIPFVENKVDEAKDKAIDFSHDIITENLAEHTNVLSVIMEKYADDGYEERAEEQKTLLTYTKKRKGSPTSMYTQETKLEPNYSSCKDNTEEETCKSLVPNIAKIIPLIHCYNQCKDKATQMQAEIDASLLAKRGLDEEIAKLQTQRAKLIGDVNCKIIDKKKIISAQRSIVDLIPNLMRMIEVGSSKHHVGN